MEEYIYILEHAGTDTRIVADSLAGLAREAFEVEVTKNDDGWSITLGQKLFRYPVRTQSFSDEYTMEQIHTSEMVWLLKRHVSDCIGLRLYKCEPIC
jgi:hypothetical protein